MPSTFSGLNIATLGLAAQQISLNTVGNNISNTNTTGYSRQTVNLVTNSPDTLYANGRMQAVGTGVNVGSITRARDTLLDQQYWQQNGTQNYWQGSANTLSQVEDIFQDSQTSGLQYAINQFSTALQSLASNSGDPATRVNVRETANSLVQNLQQDGQSLQTMANDLTSQISSQVTSINTLTSQIATLNNQISMLEGMGETPNDLCDQRDNLIDQLSSLANVNTHIESNGSYTVSVSGVTLVNGGSATKLDVVNGHNDLYDFNTNSVVVDGSNIPVNFTGGTLQSLFESRDQTVVGELNNLDNIAQYLMQNFNAQQQSGVDYNGNAGQNFFGVTGVDYTASANDPTTQTPPKSWLSELTVNSDLYSSDPTKGVNLIAAAGSGATAKSADGTNATLLSNLLTATPSTSSAALGGSSLLGYYNSMIGALGVQAQQAQNMASNQQTIVTATNNMRQSISGVNLDEEMSNMIKYQEAYQASAKMVSTINSMLDVLINNSTT